MASRFRDVPPGRRRRLVSCSQWRATHFLGSAFPCELRQNSSFRNLIFNVHEQIATLPTVCTQEPDDVIATCTSSGVAAHMPGRPWLVPGDVVRVDIEKIGAIENRVVDEDRLGRRSAETRPRQALIKAVAAKWT